MKLRNLKKMQAANDGSRSLYESIAVPEVIKALEDWKNATSVNPVLIGGLAASYYIKPRATADIDFLFLSEKEIPDNVEGFTRTRPHAFQHNETHVEIEVLTPQHINISVDLAIQVVKTAQTNDGIMIASPSGIVALKLQRLRRYDEGDIIALIETGKVDLMGWELSEMQLQKFEEIKNKMK